MKNIKEMREHALKMIDRLDSGKVDTNTAFTAAKLYESVIGSCKVELAYQHLSQDPKKIPFLEYKK